MTTCLILATKLSNLNTDSSSLLICNPEYQVVSSAYIAAVPELKQLDKLLMKIKKIVEDQELNPAGRHILLVAYLIADYLQDSLDFGSQDMT